MTCEYLYKNECYNETPPTPGSSFSLCELSVVGWTGSKNEDITDHVLIKGFPSLLPGEVCYLEMDELVNDGCWCFSNTLDSNNAERH